MQDINERDIKIGDCVANASGEMYEVFHFHTQPDMLSGKLVNKLGEYKPNSILCIKEDDVILVRTWKQLADDAISVQSACNLSGVAISFARVIREVRARLRSEGKTDTDTINCHPICILWVDKMRSLTDYMGEGKFASAYNWASNQVENKELL